MPAKFVLDPDYKGFTSNDQLKFETVSDRSGCYVTSLFLFFILVTIVIVPATFNPFRLNQAFASEGTEIEASVTHCQMLRGKNGEYAQVTYSYQIDNTPYQGNFSDQDANCSQYAPETMFRAQYLLSDPQVSRIIDPSSLSEPTQSYVLISLMLLIIVPSWVIFAKVMRRYRYDLRRYQHLIKMEFYCGANYLQVNARGSKNIATP